ncbi:MAG: hypothetical protein RBU45_04950 [Myxococcota bacterium]|jgi:hypothetical protein|nr:hypothetical protein [Myxococcota bacterium]
MTTTAARFPLLSGGLLVLAFHVAGCPVPAGIHSSAVGAPPSASSTLPPLPVPVAVPYELHQDLYGVTAVLEAGPDAWLGTDGGGLARFAATGGVLQARLGVADGLPSPRIGALALLPGGDLAVGTTAGLVRLHEGRILPLPAGLPPDTEIWALRVGPDGRLWVGWGQGLQVVAPDGTTLPQTVLEGIGVNTLRFDAAGDLWVGTAAAGVLHVAGSFAERFEPAHGLPSPGVAQLVTTRGGGLMALGPLEDGGDRFAIYDGMMWYPIRVEQPNARWQLLGLTVVADDVLLLTGFGVQRLRQVLVPAGDPLARERVESFLLSSWPRLSLQPVAPPDLAAPAPAATAPAAAASPPASPAAEEVDLPALAAALPPEDLTQAARWQQQLEAARQATAAYHRARVAHEAFAAELAGLAEARRLAGEQVATLELRHAALQADPSAAASERESVQAELVRARQAARQASVAWELAASRREPEAKKLVPLRAEAVRLRREYRTLSGQAPLDESQPPRPRRPGEAAPVSSAAPPPSTSTPAPPPDRPALLSPRLAPYPDRQAGLTPRLVLEPVELLPPLPPGAVTLWEGSEPPGALWIGSQNAGAWRWEAGRLTAFATQDLVPRGAQQGPLLDGAGNVWAIGGAGQLVRYDGARWTEEPLTLPSSPAGAKPVPAPLSAAARDLRPLALTLDGGRALLVAAAQGSQLLLVRRVGVAWERLGAVDLGLTSSQQLTLYAWAVDDEGRHWLAAGRGEGLAEARPWGLFEVQPGTSSLVYHGVDERAAPPGATAGAALPVDRVTSLAARGTVVHAGTPAGLWRFAAGEVRVFDENDGMPSESIRSLLATPGGDLWVATSEGAGRLAPDGRWTFYRKGKRGGLPSDGVLSFALAPDGQLWAATEQGLARFGGERFEAVAARLPEALRVRRLAFDEQGRSWLLLPDRLVTLRLP